MPASRTGWVTSVPHSARIWSHRLGGEDDHPVDQQARDACRSAAAPPAWAAWRDRSWVVPPPRPGRGSATARPTALDAARPASLVRARGDRENPRLTRRWVTWLGQCCHSPSAR
ncbi:SAM-dependent methyltransferase [Streptomyces sp. NPDC046870]|uniref:SAM-dependent methyltransferase n=1 Tax=Streptomyces sp. NPDC046870 TaxID=3155135 RepID=UPI003452C677